MKPTSNGPSSPDEPTAETCLHGVPLISRIGGPSTYCEPCASAFAANPRYYADNLHTRERAAEQAEEDASQPDGPHIHEVARETATSPTPSGAITVTGYCECGAQLGSHTDWIL